MHGENSRHVRFDASFFIYFVGIGAWLAFVSLSGTSYPLATVSESDVAVRIVQTGCYSASFFVIAIIDYRMGILPRYTLVVVAAGALLCSFALGMLYQLWDKNDTFLYGAAASLGCGMACGFCQWMRVLVTRDDVTTRWLLIGGSIIPIAMGFALNGAAPSSIQASVVYAALAPLSVLLLFVNVNRVGPDVAQISVQESRGAARSAMKELILPLICAMSLILVTPIANAVFGTGGDARAINDKLIPIAYLCSLGILGVAWFWLKKDISLPRFYCAFLPILASAVFLLSLFAPGQSWLVLFLGDVGTFFVSVLMVVTCLLATRKHMCSCVTIYGLFGGCVYFSGVLQLLLELAITTGFGVFDLQMTALLLLYVLMIPIFFIVGMGGHKKKRMNQEANGTSSFKMERACAKIASEYQLSKRQTELLCLFAIGRDVAYVANTLYLSPNTVRSYRKALYAALHIHSKQELIDLIEKERRGSVTDDQDDPLAYLLS